MAGKPRLDAAAMIRARLVLKRGLQDTQSACKSALANAVSAALSSASARASKIRQCNPSPAATASGRPVLLSVESKAGHGQGKPLAKVIAELTDQWSFLFAQLGVSYEDKTK